MTMLKASRNDSVGVSLPRNLTLEIDLTKGHTTWILCLSSSTMVHKERSQRYARKNIVM